MIDIYMKPQVWIYREQRPEYVRQTMNIWLHQTPRAVRLCLAFDICERMAALAPQDMPSEGVERLRQARDVFRNTHTMIELAPGVPKWSVISTSIPKPTYAIMRTTRWKGESDYDIYDNYFGLLSACTAAATHISRTRMNRHSTKSHNTRAMIQQAEKEWFDRRRLFLCDLVKNVSPRIGLLSHDESMPGYVGVMEHAGLAQRSLF